jgi:flagellar biosynthesis chaperone FliJ
MSAVTQSAFLLSSFDIDYFFPKGGLRKQIDPNLASRIARLREEIAKHLAILETVKNRIQLNCSNFIHRQQKMGSKWRHLEERLWLKLENKYL